MNLKLGSASGTVDVKNESGDTSWLIADALADRPHRIVSEAGRIDVRVKRVLLAKLPIMALTTQGTVMTNAPQDVVEETDCTTGNVSDGSRRGWRGVKSVRKGDAANPFDDFERPSKALRGDERSPGIDLISRYGTVSLTVVP